MQIYDIKSNKWIELDNINRELTINKLKDIIKDEKNPLEIDYESLAEVEMDNFFEQKFNESLRTENKTSTLVGSIGGTVGISGGITSFVATGTIITACGVGIAIAGGVVVIGVGGFLLCRSFFKQNRYKKEK